MLRRSLSAIQKWLSREPTDRDPRAAREGEVSSSRRKFFKRAAVGTVSLTGTAGLAKVVVDSVEQPDLTDLYQKDAVAGEQQLKEWEYVVMSDQEKTDMVQSFVDNYQSDKT